MDNVNVVASDTITNNNDLVVLPLSSTSSVSTNNIPIDLEGFDLDEALAVADESRRLFAASKTFVSNLPAAAVHDGDDICSVCMEGFDCRRKHIKSSADEDQEGNKRIPCGHVYHWNCITIWLSRSNSCPLCRRQISPQIISNAIS